MFYRTITLGRRSDNLDSLVKTLTAWLEPSAFSPARPLTANATGDQNRDSLIPVENSLIG
jgi:hypothetical protein